MPLPIRPQQYCDPASFVHFFALKTRNSKNLMFVPLWLSQSFDLAIVQSRPNLNFVKVRRGSIIIIHCGHAIGSLKSGFVRPFAIVCHSVGFVPASQLLVALALLRFSVMHWLKIEPIRGAVAAG